MPWAKAPGRTALRMVKVALVVPSERTIGIAVVARAGRALVTHSAQ